jgi:RNA polymerase sigma-70 factor (ECF subfamily)
MSESAARLEVVEEPRIPLARESSTASYLPGRTELRALPERAPPPNTALLHEQFARSVNRLVWQILGVDTDHSDIVQQVFCKLLLHSATLRDPERLSSWVQTVTVNTVYEELRKREVRRMFLRERVQTLVHADLSHDVEVRDLLRRAQTALDRLSPKERTVFVLHFMEGWTLNEVAEFGGYSLATAKRRLSSAKRSFRLQIANYPELLQRFSAERAAE